MTIKEFQISLDDRVKNMSTFTAPLQLAAFSATTQMAGRIFDEGKDEEEFQISRPGFSTYSTKPIYINPDTLKNMGVPGNIGVPMGKPKEGKKTGAKKRTFKKKGELFAVETKNVTKYLAGGYKELRNKLGRRIDIVDLKLSGELRMDFSNQKKVAEPRMINELEYQIRLDKVINQKKREGLEEKYGTIFSLSEREKEKFFETIQFEFKKRLAAPLK